MIEWLDPDSAPSFPKTSLAQAEPNGLLAAGGDLSPLWLVTAYSRGIFPWSEPNDIKLWWSPAPRAVITPSSFRLPRSVRKNCRQFDGRVTRNMNCGRVIRACAEPRDQQDTTWICDEMINAYQRLHDMGFADSFEVWSSKGELVGGFYGVRLGSIFFGESMFSKISNASKIAFATAAPKLFASGVTLIDCQMNTAHLSRFGSFEMNRVQFESYLSGTSETLNNSLPSML